MPWRWALIRGQRVLARANADGGLAVVGGRVEIRYKTDGTAYQASAGNLALVEGEPLLPDDTCAAVPPAPPPKAAGPKTVFKTHDPTAYIAYTDGACKGNPGAAASACILNAPDGSTIEEALYLGHATNNVAELTGVEQALVLSPPKSELVFHTDSKYAIGILSKGWKPKANQDLVARIRGVLQPRRDQVRFVHVPGHAGVPLNERADELANEAIRLEKSTKVARAAPKPPS
jgi:ribonuclease HI